MNAYERVRTKLDYIRAEQEKQKEEILKRGYVLTRLSKRRYGVIKLTGFDEVWCTGKLLFGPGTQEQCEEFLRNEYACC